MQLTTHTERQISRPPGLCGQPFGTKHHFDKWHVELSFRLPTACTPDLIAASQRLVRQNFQAGYRYKKAGVFVSGLRPETVIQPDLFGEFSWPREVRGAALVAVIDLINDRFGRDMLFWGAYDLRREWQMQQRRRSPHPGLTVI